MLGELAVRRMLKRTEFTRKLPDEFGGHSLRVSAGSDWRFAKPSWHKFYDDLFYIVRNFVRSGEVCWDIGANCGVFSFTAAYKVGGKGQLVAVEADPMLAAMLYRSRRYLPADVSGRMSILPIAVSSEMAILDLVIPINGSARNHLSSVAGNEAWGEYDRRKCISVTGDWLLQHVPPPDFIKLDIEGAEMAFMKGAARILSEVRPGFYIETSLNNIDEATALFESAGYHLFALADGQLKRVDKCAFNTITIPKEKTERYRDVLR